MRNSLSCFVLVFAIGLALPTLAQEDKLGRVTFPTSCDPKVQAQFERGVAMLHSYWFTYSRKTFEAVLQQDPNCAIAYWGIAVDLLGNTLSAPPSVKDAQAAWEALEKARAVGAKTQRERDWIEALSTYYRDHDKVALDARLLAYTKAMEQMTQRYPDDYEARVFYALTLQASAPKTDKAYTNQLKSAAILEKLLDQNPQHPGVAHFLIHAYDYPPLAEKGLAAARRYAGIAPAVPHARHMPSHIYSVVGLWEESIASNLSALEIQPDYYHASDFSVYAHLQLAQDAKAKAMIDKALSTAPRGDRPATLGSYTAVAAMPARYLLERADWKGAAALPVNLTKRPQADSLTYFTRGLGMARSGDAAGAKREIEAMQALQRALEKANDSYWAARTEEQVLRCLRMGGARGRIARSGGETHARGRRPRRRQRQACGDGEPALSDARAARRPAAGVGASRMLRCANTKHRLKENPNRYRGIYGAAQAAQAVGNREKAKAYFAKLVTLSKNADTERAELAQAKAYLAK